MNFDQFLDDATEFMCMSFAVYLPMLAVFGPMIIAQAYGLS